MTPFLALAALLLPLAGLAAPAAGFQDVLDTPVRDSRLAAKTPMNGVAMAGRRLIAVGQRGHIVYSDDAGKTWTQARVPLSADLLAVHFPTPQRGWAVGHDGVVLATTDAGASWTRQLDGRALGPLLTQYYDDAVKDGRLGNADQSAALQDDIARLARQGAENSFLDVWFDDANNGTVIGAFNLILRTNDGGKTWEPWFHRTDNPRRLHLYALRPAGGSLVIAGEQGLALRLDPGASRFVAMPTGYAGTFFGVSGSASAIVLHGLRGHVYRSGDGGRQWQAIATGVQEGLTASARCTDGSLLLATQSGRLLRSTDDGQHFAALKLDQPMPTAGLACAPGQAILAGARGVRLAPLP